MEKISQSALLVYLFDASEISAQELKQDLENLQKPGIIILSVANKIDLVSSTAKLSDFKFLGANFIPVSAKEKLNINELKNKIYNTAIKDKLTGDETLVTNVRHVEALQKTEEALIRVLNGIDSVTSDFLAMDIKLALHYLGEITGVVTTDDLLENIFSKFCIGK
jgi:tRNA modification GTPase